MIHLTKFATAGTGGLELYVKILKEFVQRKFVTMASVQSMDWMVKLLATVRRLNHCLRANFVRINILALIH